MEKRKRHWLFLVFLILLVCLLLFLYFGFHIDKVTVKGCSYYSEEEIKDMIFTSPLDYNSLYLTAKYKRMGVKEQPFVQKLTITRKGRSEIEIHVYEKSLAGCVKYMNQYIYFDKDGIVLECSEDKIEGVPQITGIDYRSFTLYEKLEVSENEIFDRILDLSQLIQKYELPLDRIHFAKDGTVMLETDGIKMYLGKREFYDEPVASLKEVLPKAMKEGLKGKIHLETYVSGDDIIFHKD